MGRHVNRLVRTLAKAKQHNLTQSKQRRGGVTDLYALDYQGEIINEGQWGYGKVGSSGTVSSYTETDEATGTTAERIVSLTKAIKANVEGATAIGIAGVVGCFGMESDVTAKRYEADYATGFRYDDMRAEPTAEKLMGSWGGFLALYGGTGLNQAGYQAGGKHWIGIGLGQWTGPRGKSLYDFAQGEGLDIFSFNCQVKFMLQEPRLSDIFKEIVKLETSVDDSTTRFLAEWEGVPGNKLAQRIAYGKEYLELIKNTLEGKEGAYSAGGNSADNINSVPNNNRTRDNFDARAEKMIEWLEMKKGKVSFSAEKRTGPNTYDSASAIYYAMKHGGFEDNTNGWAFTIDTMHESINKNGYVLVAENDREISLQRGDIIILGERGTTANSFGLAMVALNSNEVIFLSEEEGLTTANFREYVAEKQHYTYLYRLNNLVNDPLVDGAYTGRARTSSVYRVLVPPDLDRFQRWFIKILVTNNVEGSNSAGVIPLAGVTLTIQATNEKTGEIINRDVTEILRHKYPCDWVGSSTSSDAVYPNEDPMEGYDIMDLAWYLNNEERNALYSAGEKLFTIKALGNAKVTLRNFLKFSHIN